MNKLGSALGGLAVMAAVSASTQAQDHPDLVLVSNEYPEPERVTPAVFEARQAVETSAGELAALDATHGIMSEVRGVMEDDTLGLINLVEDPNLCYVLEDFDVGDECLAVAENVKLAMLDLQIAQAESREAEIDAATAKAETDLLAAEAATNQMQASIADRTENIAAQQQTITEVQSERDEEVARLAAETTRADAEAQRADANEIVVAAFSQALEQPLPELEGMVEEEI